LHTDSDLMKWLFQRMSGMTIATEPEFCDGLTNSNKIFNALDTTFFSSSFIAQKVT